MYPPTSQHQDQQPQGSTPPGSATPQRAAATLFQTAQQLAVQHPQAASQVPMNAAVNAVRGRGPGKRKREERPTTESGTGGGQGAELPGMPPMPDYQLTSVGTLELNSAIAHGSAPLRRSSDMATLQEYAGTVQTHPITRKMLLERAEQPETDKYRCAICRRLLPAEMLQCDHKVPWIHLINNKFQQYRAEDQPQSKSDVRRIRNDLNNLRLVCARCNQAKSASRTDQEVQNLLQQQSPGPREGLMTLISQLNDDQVAEVSAYVERLLAESTTTTTTTTTTKFRGDAT